VNILIDTWGWLKIREGSSGGDRVKKLIRLNAGSVFTTTANLFEVSYKAEQKAGREDAQEFIRTIRQTANILPITEEIALLAAHYRLADGLRAIDAFTYAAAILNNAKVVTGDSDFKGKPHVIFI